MSLRFKIILMGLMILALLFGFFHLFIPDTTLYDFERLHIFLFNLCTGGTILIYYTEGKRRVSTRAIIFLLTSLLFAVFSFLNLFVPAIITAVLLAGIVESVRIKHFSFFPFSFFSPTYPVSKKFHHAALLCLSIGLVISGLVILNNEYLKWFSYPKLKLNTFFLGFSFPISLITMSVIFSYMTGKLSKLIFKLQNMGFWNVNLGVIIFFIFILYEKLIPQVVVTAILFLSVILVYYLYKNLAEKTQEKYFLTSGIFFLLYTAVTGIIYILLEFKPDYPHDSMKFLLRMHSFASLYGWNLTGLAVICRRNDFPIRMNSKWVITIHWLTAIILAPLGTYSRIFAISALICYTFFIYILLFSKEGKQIVTK